MDFRLSDFQVNEIELDGTIVRITSRILPAKEDDRPLLKRRYIHLMKMILNSYFTNLLILFRLHR